MSFTNRFGAGEEAVRSYVERMISLVGDRDPLEILCATSAQLRELTSGIAENRLQRPEADGKWSALQVLQHLADSEFSFGFRIRMALGQTGARLAGFDQDGWAARLAYRNTGAELFIAAFDAMRAFNILLYRSLDEEALSRTAVHEERGTESVRRMLQMNAAHDLVHVRQLQRILSSTESSRT